MSNEERLKELKDTLQKMADEDFIIEIPLKKEDVDAEEEPV